MTADALRELADLIERALYDLERGWVEAARDALGRAARIVRPFLNLQPEPTMQPDQTPQKPPRVPVNDRWPDVKTDRPGYPPAPNPYAPPTKPAEG